MFEYFLYGNKDWIKIITWLKLGYFEVACRGQNSQFARVKCSEVLATLSRDGDTWMTAVKQKPPVKSESFVLIHEFVHVCVVVLQCSAYRNFEKCQFW